MQELMKVKFDFKKKEFWLLVVLQIILQIIYSKLYIKSKWIITCISNYFIIHKKKFVVTYMYLLKSNLTDMWCYMCLDTKNAKSCLI